MPPELASCKSILCTFELNAFVFGLFVSFKLLMTFWFAFVTLIYLKIYCFFLVGSGFFS